MHILSIESSSSTCGVALAHQGVLLGEYSTFVNNSHNEMLGELTRRILTDHKLETKDLWAVAVNVGPGSFTGLRIGVSFAKGLCLMNNIKIIAVPALTALAEAAREFAESINSPKICAVLSSHKNFVYFQEFNIDISEKNSPGFIDVALLQDMLNDNDIVCGNGASLVGKGKRLSGLERPTPRFIARYAELMNKRGEFINSEDAAPMYVQDFVPNIKVS